MTPNSELTRLYRIARETLAEGANMVERLTRDEGVDRRVAIEIAYALQSGSYTAYSETETAIATRREGHRLLKPVMSRLDAKTVLDCGAGEATRWFDFDFPLAHLTLLDASWHRLQVAKGNVAAIPAVAQASFVKGDMLTLPYAAGSFDVVFTSHAVEPNTDADAERIVAGMFAIARKAVVMFEPNYRTATPVMRARMERHGYARNTWDAAHGQPGFDCIAEGDFEISPNPDNRTSYMIFQRRSLLPESPVCHIAPVTGIPLERRDGYYRDIEGCMAYPIIEGVACLAEEDGIFIGQPPPAAPV